MTWLLRIGQVGMGLGAFGFAVACGLAGNVGDVARYGGASILCAVMLVVFTHLWVSSEVSS
jgi:hypothetical protein